jgi:hypothetical protein
METMIITIIMVIIKTTIKMTRKKNENKAILAMIAMKKKPRIIFVVPSFLLQARYVVICAHLRMRIRASPSNCGIMMSPKNTIREKKKRKVSSLGQKN